MKVVKIMADTLPGDLVVQYQAAFQHFDTNQTGFIPTKQLGPLLRYCAENPSEAEVQVSSTSRLAKIIVTERYIHF